MSTNLTSTDTNMKKLLAVRKLHDASLEKKPKASNRKHAASTEISSHGSNVKPRLSKKEKMKNVHEWADKDRLKKEENDAFTRLVTNEEPAAATESPTNYIKRPVRASTTTTDANMKKLLAVRKLHDASLEKKPKASNRKRAASTEISSHGSNVKPRLSKKEKMKNVLEWADKDRLKKEENDAFTRRVTNEEPAAATESPTNYIKRPVRASTTTTTVPPLSGSKELPIDIDDDDDDDDVEELETRIGDVAAPVIISDVCYAKPYTNLFHEFAIPTTATNSDTTTATTTSETTTTANITVVPTTDSASTEEFDLASFFKW